jgi:hypothetical protein
MLEKYVAGENIVSHCTKCKASCDHTIVAMEGETIAKVKCRTCSSVHKFRNPLAVKKARTTRKKAGPQDTVAVLWQTCISQSKGKELIYNMAVRYRVGDILLHDKFGKGVVRKLAMNKCHVLFEDKERLMASAN